MDNGQLRNQRVEQHFRKLLRIHLSMPGSHEATQQPPRRSRPCSFSLVHVAVPRGRVVPTRQEPESYRHAHGAHRKNFMVVTRGSAKPGLPSPSFAAASINRGSSSSNVSKVGMLKPSGRVTRNGFVTSKSHAVRNRSPFLRNRWILKSASAMSRVSAVSPRPKLRIWARSRLK